MNDVRRLRLQKQIFRHVATYYQKMAKGHHKHDLGASESIAPTSEGLPPATNDTPAAVDSPAATHNPFAQFDAETFTEQVRDYCTFTRCELSSDGSFAKIFVSIWGTPQEQERIIKDIKRHAHGMRTSIAKHIRMRAIPQLAFVQDHSFEKAAETEKLL